MSQRTAEDHADALRRKREEWEAQWGASRADDFAWHVEDAPPELAELVRRPDRPRGAALDVGCGNGVATIFLAQHFRPSIGLDIAEAATRQAKQEAARGGADADFLVAAAPDLPFRDGAFGVVFDRGCMQSIPRQAWPEYLREVERLLAPGGMFQLFVSRLAATPPVLSLRGVKQRVRRVKAWRRGSGRGGRYGRGELSPELIREMLPPGLHEVEMRQSAFETKQGTTRSVVYALFRKP